MQFLKKHHSFQYLASRLRQIYFQKTHPRDPWLVPSAIRLLDQLIKPEDVGLEFGSGRSTRWLAQRCKFLYSVEHHEAWYEKVKNEISELKNVDYRYRPVGDGNVNSYTDIFQELEADSLDFLLDDGKFRDEVALLGLSKLKHGGFLIIDNAERYIKNDFKLPDSVGPNATKMPVKWQSVQHLVLGWRKIWYSDGVSSTLILLKP